MYVKFRVKEVLPVIVLAQFMCTSLWFAGNAVLPDLAKDGLLTSQILAHLTSAVQIGFILGTLVFAVLAVADRISPSKVFFTSAVIAASFNLLITLDELPPSGMLFSRILTGFFLAGIYPVGMKIASDYYQQGLGRSLGFLVGALVLGTAFPHLLRTITVGLPWRYVIFGTSALATLGGFAIYFLVPDGPHRRIGQRIQLNSFLSGFKNLSFRSAAFGYFGHMWELYTFWAFVPVMLQVYFHDHYAADIDAVSLYAFLIIASGSLACVIGGFLSQRFGPKRIALLALCSSGLCCLLSPFFLLVAPTWAFLTFLFFWGMVVIADSPLFSTLVARHAPEETRGTALTIVNCVGFAITIISIQMTQLLSTVIAPGFLYWILAVGPTLGVVSLIRLKSNE